jgi:broad specificity phosphatase PhoE
MTYQEIKTQNPAEYKLRAQYKLSYRYPMGESYIDLIQRLEPIIFEIERSRHPIIIVIAISIIGDKEENGKIAKRE